MVAWQTKSLVQKAFSLLPKGEYWNYLCQRYITKGLPISYEKFVADVGSKVYKPLKVFMTQDKNLSSKVYFEFGAGWDLLAPIGVSLAGMGDIRIVDVRPLVRPNLIQQTLNYYANYLEGGGGILLRWNAKHIFKIRLINFQSKYPIHFHQCRNV